MGFCRTVIILISSRLKPTELQKITASIMARKKSSIASGIQDLESSAAPILEIDQSQPLFSTAAHPTRPILATGHGTGHLFCYSYDDVKLQEYMEKMRAASLKKSDTGSAKVSLLQKKWWMHEKNHAAIADDSLIKTNWNTRRHKGSCRSVTFDVLENAVGENIYSVGTDHMVKKASTETGKVVAKTDFSAHLGEEAKDRVTTMALSATHPFLLTGTEDGNILVFDSSRLQWPELKFRCDRTHEDAVTKILAMPAVSPYHYLSLGSTVLSHIDIRKGIVTQSDDQSDELLSMCYPTNYINSNKNDTVIVGHGEGIVTLWKNSTNRFMDQLSRIKVNKNASIETVISPMNAGDNSLLDSIWCGDSDGLLHRINYKKGKVVEARAHSLQTSKLGLADEVSGLDIDYEYRLISSGMESLKIWSLQTEENIVNSLSSRGSEDNSDDESEDGESDLELTFCGLDSDSGVDLDSEAVGMSKNEKDYSVSNANAVTKDSQNDFESGDEDTNDCISIEEVKTTNYSMNLAKNKKKKIRINRIGNEEDKNKQPKNKKRKLKPLAKIAPNNGIAKFDGL